MPLYQDYAKLPTTSTGKIQTYTPPKPGLSEAQKERRAAVVAERRRQAEIATRATQISTAPIQQVQAEVGDDFGTMAERLGVPEDAFIKANELDTTIKAGAVYNVPEQPLSAITGLTPNVGYDVPRALPGETTEEFLARINPPLTPQPSEGQSFYDWATSLPGGNIGGGLQNILKSGEEAIKDFLFPPKGPTGKPLESPAAPRQTGIPEEPLSAITGYISPEDLAYTPPGPVSPFGFTAQPFTFDPSPPGVTYDPGQQQDFIDPWQIREAEKATTVPDAPWQMPTHPNENPEVYFAINQMGGDAGAQYQADVQAWDDSIMAHYEEGLGRGAGITGWIEERTGLVGVDPWNMTDEEFEIFLAAFDTEELNYLESHGILVPEDVYVGGGVPAYGTGGTRRGGGGRGGRVSQPVGYGGYASQQPSYARRESYLGLTSWSI